MRSHLFTRRTRSCLTVSSFTLLVGCIGGTGPSPYSAPEDAATVADAKSPTDSSGADSGRDAGIPDAAVMPPPDASAGDAGGDAGHDATIGDAGADGGFDAGFDAGADGGFDAGGDAGIDASIDSGGDAGIDSGSDASEEAGPPDAAVDAALDTGAPSIQFPTTGNLILNWDAELGTGSTDGTAIVPVPNWVVSGEANVIVYGASGGYPLSTDPGPTNRGLNFFAGGPNDTTSTFTQHVDLSGYAPAIAQGTVTFAIDGYLGGYSTQDDNAVLTVTFVGPFPSDAGGASDGGDAGAVAPPLGSGSIGPVLAVDRGSATGLVERTASGTVPAGTVAADVTLVMTRVSGSANDGYADSLSLTLTGN